MRNMIIKNEQHSHLNSRELKAFEIVKPYFPNGFLFETGFSMSFQAIQHILNDIIVYKPNSILEFGSGLSTQIISSFIQKNQLKTQLYSIDEDQQWQESLGITNPLVTLLSFPLISNSPYSWNKVGIWYDIPVNHDLQKLHFDMILVDAPKGNICKNSRYGFIPFLQNRLGTNSIVFLDDSNRPDETEVVRLAQINFSYLVNTQNNIRYTRLSGRESFYTRPS
ncbi:class I SAM-dependent methyltransferase [Algoriphagus chordae]|nr:class I SAM-dependent methyltransferase [Algoriphagus chordae]